jgi:hypothetical protein
LAYIVVLGYGSWMWGKHRFTAGVTEELDPEVIEAARGAPPYVLVLDEPPILAPEATGPLTLEDIRVGSPGGVMILQPKPEPGQEPEPEEEAVVAEFPCRWCTAGFPHAGARDRHVEFHHQVAAKVPTPVEPVQESEPALTDA